jgi:hypothetical protein
MIVNAGLSHSRDIYYHIPIYLGDNTSKKKRHKKRFDR